MDHRFDFNGGHSVTDGDDDNGGARSTIVAPPRRET
jgi:hypothetical protein